MTSLLHTGGPLHPFIVEAAVDRFGSEGPLFAFQQAARMVPLAEAHDRVANLAEKAAEAKQLLGKSIIISLQQGPEDAAFPFCPEAGKRQIISEAVSNNPRATAIFAYLTTPSAISGSRSRSETVFSPNCNEAWIACWVNNVTNMMNAHGHEVRLTPLQRPKPDIRKISGEHLTEHGMQLFLLADREKWFDRNVNKDGKIIPDFPSLIAEWKAGIQGPRF